MLENIDKNHDGKISLSEFLDALKVVLPVIIPLLLKLFSKGKAL